MLPGNQDVSRASVLSSMLAGTRWVSVFAGVVNGDTERLGQGQRRVVGTLCASICKQVS